MNYTWINIFMLLLLIEIWIYIDTLPYVSHSLISLKFESTLTRLPYASTAPMSSHSKVLVEHSLCLITPWKMLDVREADLHITQSIKWLFLMFNSKYHCGNQLSIKRIKQNKNHHLFTLLKLILLPMTPSYPQLKLKDVSMSPRAKDVHFV